MNSWTFFFALLASIAISGIQGFEVTVHWTHNNGSQVNLTAEEFARLAHDEREGGGIERRNAVRDYKYLWYLGTVYYDIDARTADFRLLQILYPAFTFFHQYTCIRWKRRVPGRDDQIKDYVIFSMPYTNDKLCNSAVGRQSGRQYINLDKECVNSLALVLHQMVHALGFYHTHARTDRDHYIQVHPYNAAPGNRKFFDIGSAADMDTMGFPYESKSLMHFGSFKYSVGGQPTITGKIPGMKLGNDQALTIQDIAMINYLYNNCKMSCRFANGHCDQQCYDESPGVVRCSCDQGYRLNYDSKSCFDFNECEDYNGGCDQICVPHGAWFRCECKSGFALDKNGYSCRASDLCDSGALKCDHSCVFNKCSCDDGYYLHSDGTSCIDKNECATNNAGCEGGCTNTVGSFICTCGVGQFLSNDGFSCTDVVCGKPSEVANAVMNCTSDDYVEGTACTYECKDGFKLDGGHQIHCTKRVWTSSPPICVATDRCQLDNGGCEQLCWANTWTDVKCSCRNGFTLDRNQKNCTDIEPPTIVMCPDDIYADTVPKKSFASVTWDLPTFYDNVGAKIVSGPVMQDKIGGIFDIGAHSVDYIIEDEVGLRTTCSFKIKVSDKEVPDMFHCPDSRFYNVSSIQKLIEVDWEDPSFWDNSEQVKVTSDLPEDRQLQPRSQEIHYLASDPSGNTAACTVKVTVKVTPVTCDEFPYTPTDGYMECDQFVFGTQCRPSCNSGYDLTKDKIPPYYTCINKTWQPVPEQINCPGLSKPRIPPRLYYKFEYRHSCKGESMDGFGAFANVTANAKKDILCAASRGACNVEVQYECVGDRVVLLVYTDMNIRTPITDRYMQQLKDNIKKHQNGMFFYMPIGTSVTAPFITAEGLKATPMIDFQCDSSDIIDQHNLRCYKST